MNFSFVGDENNDTQTAFGISLNSNIDTESSFGRHGFLRANPWTAIPSVAVLSVASLGGTFGNVLTLLSVALCKDVRNVESVFIVNLAISDLYVTAVADPMSIVAKLEGEHFFDSVPNLCQTIASLCTISCVTSLMTIAMMSLNRYIFVCQHQYYDKIFSVRNCVVICMCLYCVGLTLVLLNQAGLGDHSFDKKSLECIWDRMATYPYTVVFSVTLVWIPCVVIGICYFLLFLYVRRHSKIMASNRNRVNGDVSPPPGTRNLQLHVIKSLFLIYAVFVVCWAPYALIMVVDVNDTFSHEAHVYITTFAHLHPSVNWLIYCKTQKKFAKAYSQILSCTIMRSQTDLYTTGTSRSRGEKSSPSGDMVSVIEASVTKSIELVKRPKMAEDDL